MYLRRKLPYFRLSQLSQNRANICQVCLWICAQFTMELHLDSEKEIQAQEGEKKNPEFFFKPPSSVSLA